MGAASSSASRSDSAGGDSASKPLGGNCDSSTSFEMHFNEREQDGNGEMARVLGWGVGGRPSSKHTLYRHWHHNRDY